MIPDVSGREIPSDFSWDLKNCGHSKFLVGWDPSLPSFVYLGLLRYAFWGEDFIDPYWNIPCKMPVPTGRYPDNQVYYLHNAPCTTFGLSGLLLDMLKLCQIIL